MRCSIIGLVILTNMLSITSLAQQGRPRAVDGIFNVDIFLDSYIRLVAKKYDLNAEQSEFTNELIKARASKFIDNHDDELFELLDRMLDVRAGGDMTAEELIAWGQQAQPIYEEAKGIVIEANDEWRESLTDEQRAIHDGDVALMWDNFGITETHLERMVGGEMTVEEFRNPPNYVQPEDRPLTEPQQVPVKPEPRVEPEPRIEPEPPTERANPNESRLPPPKRGKPVVDPQQDQAAPSAKKRPGRTVSAKSQDPKTFETAWDKYTRDFVAKYQLNAAQAQKAEAILASCKRQGQQVVMRNSTKLEKIDTDLAELKKVRNSETKPKIARYEEQRKKLLQPLTDIFEKRLKPQLDRLPTRSQREAADKSTSKKPEKKATKKPSTNRNRK